MDSRRVVQIENMAKNTLVELQKAGIVCMDMGYEIIAEKFGTAANHLADFRRTIHDIGIELNRLENEARNGK